MRIPAFFLEKDLFNVSIFFVGLVTLLGERTNYGVWGVSPPFLPVHQRIQINGRGSVCAGAPFGEAGHDPRPEALLRRQKATRSNGIPHLRCLEENNL